MNEVGVPLNEEEMRETEKALRSRIKVLEAAVGVTKGSEKQRNQRKQRNAISALVKVEKQQERYRGLKK